MSVTAGARMAHTLLARLEAEGKLDNDLRYEILDGELVIRGAPSFGHGRAISVLDEHLRSWTRQHGGEVVVGVGVEIGELQLVPDLSFVGPERAGDVDPAGFTTPPDLVAEVTSAGTRTVDLQTKRDLYERIGVPEYWVVDLAEQRVLVYRRDAGGRYGSSEPTSGTLTAEAAPGLEIPLAELIGEQRSAQS